MCKRAHTTCTNYANHSRSNNQQEFTNLLLLLVWGRGIYDHLMSTRVIIMIMNRYYMSSRNYEANDYDHDMDSLISSHTNCMFHILQEVGAERKPHVYLNNAVLPCSCYLPKCKCMARFCLHILCIKDKFSLNTPSLFPIPLSYILIQQNQLLQ